MKARTSRFCYALLALPLLAGLAPAQDDIESDRIEFERGLAQARFQASRASLDQLVREREAAAKEMYEVRRQDMEAGRLTLDVLEEAHLMLLHSRQSLPPKVALNRPALEQAWRSAYAVHYLIKWRYEAGRVNVSDYHQALYRLRDAEVQLALTRPRPK